MCAPCSLRCTCLPDTPPGVLRVADLLASPHGVDRSRELVRPWSTRPARRGDGVNRQTVGSVTLTLRPNGCAGFAAGHTRRSPSRSTACVTRCFSLAGSARAGGRPPRADRQGARRRPGVVVPGGAAQPGLVVGPGARSGRLHAPRPPSRAAGAGQRGQRHHPGPVDPPHAVRRGPRPARHLPPLRTRVRRCTGPRSPPCPPATPNLWVVEAYTQAPGTGYLDGRFT